jgi:hypothetical protein
MTIAGVKTIARRPHFPPLAQFASWKSAAAGRLRPASAILERTPTPPVSLPVTTTPEADARFRKIDDWWRESRSSAPDLFIDELTASLEVIVTRLKSVVCIGNRPWRAHVAFW